MAQAEANAKALKTGILPCFLKPNTISLRDYQLILCMLEYLNYRAKFHIIVPSLTHIFNLSLETGIYVDDRKRASVISIYKADDERKCENYRPISILPVVSKVFEREVFNQVYRYLSENSLLSRFQSGFRPKHSTLSVLIQMCDDWLQSMDNGNLNCVVFLDVQTAFESVNHEILLTKCTSILVCLVLS